MKQIICSIAISFFAVVGVAQTTIPEQQANYEVAILAFSKVPLPTENDKFVQNDSFNRPDSITIRVFKNTDGEVVRTLRYYTEVDVLPIHIRAKFSRKFADYVPTAIVEEHNVTGISYIINLYKGSRWLQVHSSQNGRLSILHRYHNSLLDARSGN